MVRCSLNKSPQNRLRFSLMTSQVSSLRWSALEKSIIFQSVQLVKTCQSLCTKAKLVYQDVPGCTESMSEKAIIIAARDHVVRCNTILSFLRQVSTNPSVAVSTEFSGYLQKFEDDSFRFRQIFISRHRDKLRN